MRASGKGREQRGRAQRVLVLRTISRRRGSRKAAAVADSVAAIIFEFRGRRRMRGDDVELSSQDGVATWRNLFLDRVAGLPQFVAGALRQGFEIR